MIFLVMMRALLWAKILMIDHNLHDHTRRTWVTCAQMKYYYMVVSSFLSCNTCSFFSIHILVHITAKLWSSDTFSSQHTRLYI